jgi:hypothetical protein
MSIEEQGRSRKASDGIQEEPCTICRALREFQSDCVDILSYRMPRSLCNFHTWLVAKVAEASVGADVLLRMLEQTLKNDSTGAGCTLCARIAQEEARALGEFAQNLNNQDYLQQLRERGGLCIPHARKLFALVPSAIRDAITLALQRKAMELRGELETLSRNAKAGMTTHAGILGRAAEYLVANRGLDIKR